MKTVTKTQLIDLLANVPSACAIGFTALTDARPLKTGNPFASILKLSRVWPIAGASYESAVNRSLARQGEKSTFKARPANYVRVSPLLGVMNGTGNHVLLCAFSPRATQAGAPLYFVRDQAGAPLRHVSKSTVAPFLQKVPVVSARQEQAGASEEDCVIWRAFGVANLLRVSLNGETYRVRG
jgi:hypothetical protein